MNEVLLGAWLMLATVLGAAGAVAAVHSLRTARRLDGVAGQANNALVGVHGRVSQLEERAGNLEAYVDHLADDFESLPGSRTVH